MNHRSPCDEELTHRGPHIVYLELRRDDALAQSTATGVGKSIVSGVAYDSPMYESVLLLQLSSDRNLQFSATPREAEQLGAEQNAEGLGGENALSPSEHVFHRRRSDP